MKYDAKCILIGRKPRGEHVYKTAFVKIFNVDDPFLPDVMPEKELDYANIREVVIKDFNVEYLLEGNDLLIRGVKSFSVTEDKDNKIIISK